MVWALEGGISVDFEISERGGGKNDRERGEMCGVSDLLSNP